MQSTVFVSHRAQAVIFEYIILLVGAAIISLAILNIKEPHISYESEAYSCILTSYYGKITCYFPDKIQVHGMGKRVTVNGIRYKVPFAKGDCTSNKITFNNGVISCSMP